MSILKTKAEDKGVSLLSDFSALQHQKVVHDENRIKQVLLNFYGNAIKFTDVGHVTIKAESFVKNEEIYLTLSVIDTGIGIKEEDKDKLFKLFGYVQDSQGMNVHGIGLGLTISKKIVEQFDGEVGFESTEGEGSIFKFTVKLHNEIENSKNGEEE